MDVKKPCVLVKLGAVASSVLHVGGCISQRVGGFDWLTGASQPVEAAASQDEKPGAKSRRATFIPSTKRFLPDGAMSGLTPAGTFTPETDVKTSED